MSTTDGMEFCIYDAVKKVSTWVKENEKGNDFIVKGHDENRDSVCRCLPRPHHASSASRG